MVYVNAIVLEALRWRPVVPLSVPHMATVDDELRGYFIPEGTIIVPNTWYYSLLESQSEGNGN